MANAIIDTITPEAADALNALHAICASGYSEKVEILPGDILLINNKKTLHARTAFNPQFENNFSLRWLQRIYVKKDLQCPSHVQVLSATPGVFDPRKKCTKLK